MRRNSWILATLIFFALQLASAPESFAQGEDPEMTFDEDDLSKKKKPAPAPAPDPGPDELEMDPVIEDAGEPPAEDDLLGDGPSKKVDLKTVDASEGPVSWKDIVVVVRKPFLKQRRLELLPSWGVTMNDNLLRHFVFMAQINWYLTDVLSVGLEGQYFIDNLREPYDLVARQSRRLPTVNKYNYGAALNFSYVPIYGKFAILDKHIVTWEAYFTAGVGALQSEVIPRDPALQPFKNILISPNVGASMRFFIFKWLTVNAGIRDYIFIDKFEATDRIEVSGSAAKDNADSKLINNVVFQAGVSFWIPTSFEYTTFR